MVDILTFQFSCNFEHKKTTFNTFKRKLVLVINTSKSQNIHRIQVQAKKLVSKNIEFYTEIKK